MKNCRDERTQTFVLMLSMYRVMRLLFSLFNNAISPIMPEYYDQRRTLYVVSLPTLRL